MASRALLGAGSSGMAFSVAACRMAMTHASAKKLFGYSILYLFAIFSCLMLDHFACR